jgi:voltage-gated potassium channel
VSERPVTKNEIGHSPSEVHGERVIAVVRNKTLRRFYDPTVATLEAGDQVVVVRQAAEEIEQQAIGAARRNRVEQSR